MFKPSEFQLAIFEAYRKTNQNIIISAGPGSGKTKTLFELSKMVLPWKKDLVTSFANSITDVLKERIRTPNIEVNGLHSLGLKILYRKWNGNVKVSEFKSFNYCQRYLKEWNLINDKKKNYILFNISRLIELYKLYDLKTKEELEDISDKFDIDCFNGEIDKALKVISNLKSYNKSEPTSTNPKIVDFSDMIYIPISSDIKLNLPQYDEIFVDEIQDLNVAQQKFIKKLLKPEGRIIGVGDKYQSIYTFLGADINSFNKFAALPKTIQLPLSISYRCPKIIVKEANKIYNVILPNVNNEEGEIREDSYKTIKDGDFVLCRNNSPLIDLFIELTKEDKKCFIKGREFGEALLGLINKIDDLDKKEAFEELKKLGEEIVKKLKDKGITNPYSHPKYLNYSEKVSIIKKLHNYYGNFLTIKTQLDKIYKDEGEGIQLMTIHKSKGLESDNIFFLRPDLLPSKYAEQDWEIEQENNLRYVLLTRTKKNFIYINDL